MRKTQNANSGQFDKEVVAKRTKRHLDELEVRSTRRALKILLYLMIGGAVAFKLLRALDASWPSR